MQNCHCQLNSSTEPKDGLFLNQKQTEYFSFYNCLKILLTTMGCKAWSNVYEMTKYSVMKKLDLCEFV